MLVEPYGFSVRVHGSLKPSLLQKLAGPLIQTYSPDPLLIFLAVPFGCPWLFLVGVSLILCARSRIVEGRTRVSRWGSAGGLREFCDSLGRLL